LSPAILASDDPDKKGGSPMPTVTTERFREEASRRLIDTFELMLILGLRSRQAVWKRVEAGKLPPPVITKANTVALWDKDDIVLPD
jgi:predicted DNA-binding transcriptional regulator AlpA